MRGDDVDLLWSMGTEAVLALNSFMRFLYESDAWLAPADAGRAGELAAKFLRRCNDCALRAQRRTLFPLKPKFHCLHHMYVDLLYAGEKQIHMMNPLVYSTQLSEDFVGRPSRLSRRVSARGTVRRVMQRHLQSAYTQWVKAGLLIEGIEP